MTQHPGGTVVELGTGLNTRVANTWPARYRCGLLLLARLLPAVVNSYKLNLFRLGSGPQQDQ